MDMFYGDFSMIQWPSVPGAPHKCCTMPIRMCLAATSAGGMTPEIDAVKVKILEIMVFTGKHVFFTWFFKTIFYHYIQSFSSRCSMKAVH